MSYGEGVHRPHWGTAPLRAVTVVVGYFVLGGFSLLLDGTPGGRLLMTSASLTRFALATGVALGAAVLTGVWARSAVRFWIAGECFVVVTGVLRRRREDVPLERIRAIEVVRPVVPRLWGLAEVRIAWGGDDIVLRYLDQDAARSLRAELLARAAGLPGHTPEAPERALWWVGFGHLLGSVLFRLPVLGAIALAVGLACVGVTEGQPGVLGGLIPVLLGLVRAIAVPLVTYSNLHASTSPDGLRLRYGPLEPRLVTYPPRSIQAVRIVEPLLWRRHGWARVDVTVAEGQALPATVLPVCPRWVADQVADLVFPAPHLPPADARPGSHPQHDPATRITHALSPAVGSPSPAICLDGATVAVRHGTLCRRTDVIASSTVQRLRLTANPLQRLLGRATVHLDTRPGLTRRLAANLPQDHACHLLDSTASQLR